MSTKLISIANFITIIFSATASASFIPYNWEDEDEGIWQATFQGAYYDQSNNLAQVENINIVSGEPNSSNNADLLFPPLSADPEKEWGYTANLGYIFPSHKYDIQASYTWLLSDASTSDSGIVAILENYSPVNPTNTGADVNFNFHEAELTLGNYQELTERAMFRFGLGIIFVDIKQETENANTTSFFPASFPIPDINIDGTANFKNQFRGLGPKFTLDGHFNLNQYFVLVGGAGISALWGKSEAKLNANNIATFGDGGTSLPDTNHFESSDHKTIWGLDGNAGLRFEQTLSERFAWNIEAGYQATKYFNALEDGSAAITLRGDNSIPPTVGTATENVSFEGDYYNFGPYITLGVDFM
jgi:hypothetical protein